MDKYKILQEENQRFWESLDVDTSLNAEDFALLAEEDDYLQELTVEAITL